MINKVVLIGRLTRNPDLRRTNDGTMVASFNIAVNRNYTAKDGQQQADFINCVVWRKMAESLDKYCKKGNLIGVEGALQTRTYDNAQGQRVFVTEVVCDNIQFLEPKSINNHNNQNNPNAKSNSKLSSELNDVETFDLEEDIQF